MIFLNIGEPDFTAPPLVRRRPNARSPRAARSTPMRPACRRCASASAHWYAQRFGLDIAPSRIVVTAGASAALQLACLALVDRGDEVLMPDPSYPCNRHFVAAAEGGRCCCRPRPTSASSSAPPASRRPGRERTRGVLLASPSNPTGTSIDPDEMGRIVRRGARARRLHDRRRDLPRPEFRRALRPQRALGIARRRRHLDQQLLASTSA